MWNTNFFERPTHRLTCRSPNLERRIQSSNLKENSSLAHIACRLNRPTLCTTRRIRRSIARMTILQLALGWNDQARSSIVPLTYANRTLWCMCIPLAVGTLRPLSIFFRVCFPLFRTKCATEMFPCPLPPKFRCPSPRLQLWAFKYQYTLHPFASQGIPVNRNHLNTQALTIYYCIKSVLSIELTKKSDGGPPPEQANSIRGGQITVL